MKSPIPFDVRGRDALLGGREHPQGPRASLLALRTDGHDVLAVAEGSPGIADPDVLRLSIAEDRILMTFDRDFGSLVFQTTSSAEPGVILFRFVPVVSADEPAHVLMALIEQTSLSFAGRFTVVDRDRVRQRQLPRADDTESNG